MKSKRGLKDRVIPEVLRVYDSLFPFAGRVVRATGNAKRPGPETICNESLLARFSFHIVFREARLAFGGAPRVD